MRVDPKETVDRRVQNTQKLIEVRDKLVEDQKKVAEILKKPSVSSRPSSRNDSNNLKEQRDVI